MLRDVAANVRRRHREGVRHADREPARRRARRVVRVHETEDRRHDEPVGSVLDVKLLRSQQSCRSTLGEYSIAYFVRNSVDPACWHRRRERVKPRDETFPRQSRRIDLRPCEDVR